MIQKIYTILSFLHPDVKKIIALGTVLTALYGCGATRVKSPSLDNLPGPHGSLSVDVYGFRTLQGDVLLSLFHKGVGFPDDSHSALVNLSTPVSSGRIHLDLPPLPFGLYSYSILHDENGNGEMDQSLFGTALEGYAFSNDLEGHYGPPEASAALFEIGNKPQLQELRIRYFKRKDHAQRPF